MSIHLTPGVGPLAPGRRLSGTYIPPLRIGRYRGPPITLAWMFGLAPRSRLREKAGKEGIQRIDRKPQ
jgi:hypothetical protein